MPYNFTPHQDKYCKNSCNGFTLIELIIGIVVLSLSFTVIFAMIVPSATQSAVQIHQIRASELGQAMLNEILGKAFDENSDKKGGIKRCGEDMDADGIIDKCTANENLGSDAETRAFYDDVDDYHGLITIENSLGESMGGIYSGFTLNVVVCNDSGYDGCDANGDIETAKLIKITVTTVTGESVTFSSYKANF